MGKVSGIFLGLGLVLGHWVLSGYPIDDALIQFRIARNFVEVGQPYFEVGVPLLTSSSPVWTVLVAGLFRVAGVSLPCVAVLNASLLFLAALVWGELAVRAAGRDVYWLRFIAALTTVAVLFPSSVGLMEMPLALLCSGVSVLLFLSQSRRAVLGAFILAGFSIFIRVELAVPALLLLGANVRLRKIPIIHAVLGLVAGVLPNLFFLFSYFPSIVPQGMIAKSVIYTVSSSDFVRILLENMLGSWGAQKPVGILYLVILLVTVLALIFRTQVDRESLRREWSDPATMLGLWGGLILAAYAARKVLLAEWYVPLFLLPLLLSVLLVAVRTGRRLWYLLFAELFLPLFVLLMTDLYAASGPVEYFRDFRTGSRVRKYLEVGRELSARYPTASLLAPEIGGLGFEFRGKIIDPEGIATPAALQYHPMRVPGQRSSGLNGSIPEAFVREMKPDLIVTLDMFAEELLRSPALQDYDLRTEPVFSAPDLARVSEKGLWGAKSLLILTRKNLSLSANVQQ